jgi:transposase
VPSQHDGKDAGVIAELAALGKSHPWPYAAASAWEQELAYWVDEMEAQRRIASLWLGRLEGLLARHWPEVTPRVLPVSSATLLRALAVYGGPAELAADPRATERLRAWGGPWLRPEKVAHVLACARGTVGVRLGAFDRRRLQQLAQRARDARRAVRQGQQQLRRLSKDHAIIQAQGQAIGVPTACVLWASLGDPHNYHCGGAYRKAMGLNLKECSSGTYQGQLKISKRGSARVRQWLYFAALRGIQKWGLRGWYEAKKARDGAEAMRAVVAIMRKLPLAMYRVAVDEEPFDAAKVFPGRQRQAR